MEITLIDNLAWFTEEAVSDAQKKHPNDKSAQVASVKRQLARWEREYGRSPTAADAAPQAPGFVGEFDFPSLRVLVDDCVRTLNNLVIAHKKEGLDMPVRLWDCIEQADLLVNQVQDAIPVRTIVRYPAYIDVYVESDATGDNCRIVRTAAIPQLSDAGAVHSGAFPFVFQTEDETVGEQALEFTNDHVPWPDPKLEG